MPEPKSPFKRVRRAFDRADLKRICEMHETEFVAAYDMTLTPVPMGKWWDAEYPAFYAHLDRGSSILAVAHLDTVVKHKQRTANFIDTAAGPVVYSGALDDRLGAYTILELLPKLGVNVDVLLTTGEESGDSTAQHFASEKDYQWVIEFDRGGTDVVMYQYEDAATVDLVEESGARVGSGSFSDIAYLEQLGVKAFNWGVGYRDYHGPRGHAYLEDYWMMIAYFLKFHAVNAGAWLHHEEKRYGGGYGRALWSSMFDDEGECEAWCGRVAELDDDGLCAECAEILNDEEVDAVIDGDVVSDDFNVVNERLLAIEAKSDRVDA